MTIATITAMLAVMPALIHFDFRDPPKDAVTLRLYWANAETNKSVYVVNQYETEFNPNYGYSVYYADGAYGINYYSFVDAKGRDVGGVFFGTDVLKKFAAVGADKELDVVCYPNRDGWKRFRDYCELGMPKPKRGGFCVTVK